MPAGLPKELFDTISVQRNPIHIDFLGDMGYVECLGTGIPRRKNEMLNLNFLDPEFKITDTFFRIVLYNKKCSKKSIKKFEDLKDMKHKKNGRRFNKKLGIWSFKQFETYLKYKSEDRQKLVISVNPKYTSQTCSKCGFKDKLNRKRSNFKCLKCKYELHADLNASKNIAELGKPIFSWLSVNEPIVATQGSYKPTILMVGN